MEGVVVSESLKKRARDIVKVAFNGIKMTKNDMPQYIVFADVLEEASRNMFKQAVSDLVIYWDVGKEDYGKGVEWYIGLKDRMDGAFERLCLQYKVDFQTGWEGMIKRERMGKKR